MSKTTIFVSSTCYDLAAIREDIRRFVTGLGHEALLSEYPSFPVDPDEGTITNCKKNVAGKTDILILIIGGRRGAVDPQSGKSITNLEYDEARRIGIPCFVLVKREVLNLLPVWKKNSSADFTPSVDYPEVFQFIDRIKAESQWIFPFEKLEELEECIKFQLSVMFGELLARKRTGTIDPLASFATESSAAQRLAREKPAYWEYLLTAELLKTKLAEVRRQYNRLKDGLFFNSSKPIAAKEFWDWALAKVHDEIQLIKALQAQLGVIQASWGPAGESRDANKIQQCTNEFVHLCQHLLQWEADLRSTLPPGFLRPLRDTMQGWTEGILREMERLPDELLLPFKDNNRPTGTHEITLHLKSPPAEQFLLEIERLRQTLHLL